MKFGKIAVVPMLAMALGGCWSQPGSSPLSLASNAPGAQPAPVAMSLPPEDRVGHPQLSQLVAVRGGDIMVQSPAEQAARRRQLAALRKETDPTNFALGMRPPAPAKPMTAGAAAPNSALQ